MINFQIIALALLLLSIWGCIFYRAARSPLGWYSPIGLVSISTIMFFLIPPLYFQLTSWNFQVRHYFEGLPLLFFCILVYTIPFTIFLLPVKQNGYGHKIFKLLPNEYGKGLWLFIIPLVFGIWRKIYLFSIGFQSRFAREVPQFMGSESASTLIEITSEYYPLCYLSLFAFGNKIQRRIGVAFWIFDGFLQVYSLSRTSIIRFILHSAIFLLLLGWRMKRRHLFYFIVIFFFVMTSVNNVFYYGLDLIGSGKMNLSAAEVVTLIGESTAGIFKGDFRDKEEVSAIRKTLDDTFFRLYDARSSSAVLLAIPETIPFGYGETFKNIPYALIPRFFYSEKPELAEIHLLTKQAMTDQESGTPPVGTVAELYYNFGFITVFLGGFVISLIVYFHTAAISRGWRINPAWLIVYPFCVEWYLAENTAFTQRINAGFRMFLMYLILASVLSLLRKKQKHAVINSDAKKTAV